jgi:hypothetical protein
MFICTTKVIQSLLQGNDKFLTLHIQIEDFMDEIILQEFDTNIFKKKFYRLKGHNKDLIRSEFLKIYKDNIIIDAKINASNIDLANFLKELGFFKICTQVELEYRPMEVLGSKYAKITQTKKIDKGVALELAKNFSVDRFSQDARISRNKRERFYQEWIINSFANKDIMLSVIGNNFCSFKVRGDSIKIDLLSVLDKRRGYAKDLLISINDYAVDHNIKKINVVTECENYPAFKAYTSNGFSVVGFLNCFHYKTKT